MPGHDELRDDVLLHRIDDSAALLLDRGTGAILGVAGRASAALGRDGGPVEDRQVASALGDLGLTRGADPDRRAVLRSATAASLGLTTVILPAASAAASPATDGSTVADLSAPSDAPVVNLGRGGFAVTSLGSHAYVAAGGGGAPYVVKVDIPSMTVVGQVQVASNSAWPWAVVTDGTDLFVSTDDDRGIHRIALTGGGDGTGGMVVSGTISVATRVFDLALSGSYLFGLTNDSPSRIYKIALVGGGAGTAGMQQVSSLTLPTGENTGWRMEVVDGVAYTVHLTSPGRINVVDLDDGTSAAPVRLGGAVLETGEDRLRTVTSSGTDVFVVTETSPSVLVRFASSGGGEGSGGLLRLGALTLPSTAKPVALTSAGGYVFVGAYESTRTVNRVALSGGDAAAGGMRIDSTVVLPSTTGYTSLHDAVVVGDRLVFVSRGEFRLTSIPTGI